MLAQYDERERLIGAEQMRDVERAVMLEVIDRRWKEHLLDMDYLQEGIHLRALGQRDPLVEYRARASICSRTCSRASSRTWSRRS